eukprot:CAMPEP_0174367260 /NCGR_PEP_ID=MMETSP0811_2-20130205/84583_1 /TAXON_ID=73025 ORGANISM="Eutreptiella gymnastica-like, Strain CCMP1594" /NCGR_SAMPLE_ID=MMETSP0811_2 /ASSEMBLY_ACC=CAM_ASM_000667 /LENGTH=165 /DNA_ID=CAMNT_0015509661 /DNA_START=374 /DNA_END=872 /DNA_ORIENTATION=-
MLKTPSWLDTQAMDAEEADNAQSDACHLGASDIPNSCGGHTSTANTNNQWHRGCGLTLRVTPSGWDQHQPKTCLLNPNIPQPKCMLLGSDTQEKVKMYWANLPAITLKSATQPPVTTDYWLLTTAPVSSTHINLYCADQPAPCTQGTVTRATPTSETHNTAPTVE